MFNNAKSISFRGGEVKQIVRVRDNAIIYQKKEDDYIEIEFTGQIFSSSRAYNDNNGLIGDNIFIDYGDGNIVKYTGDYSHTYASTGNYTIKIYGVTSLGEYCFAYCTGLTSIDIPDSITNFGDASFLDCTDLTSINIPDGFISFGIGCFRDCTNLTSINIPDSVRSLEDTCFMSCTNLTSIDIPDSITSLGDYCFWGCTSLTSIDIPDSIVSIGKQCFSGCTGLTSINIPDSVRSLGNNCFMNCSNLTSIDIPDSVTSLGSDFFKNCTNLTEVVLHWSTSNTIVSYDSTWISNTNAQLKFIIPSGTISLYVEKGYPAELLNDLFVCSNLTELENALSSVRDRDLIYIKNGTYTLSQSYSIPCIKVIGEKENPPIINVTNQFFITNSNQSGTNIFENLQFRGTTGGIDSTSQFASLEVRNCNWKNMENKYNFHAIRITGWSDDKHILIENCEFINNRTTGYGHYCTNIHCIAPTGPKNLTVRNCIFNATRNNYNLPGNVQGGHQYRVAINIKEEFATTMSYEEPINCYFCNNQYLYHLDTLYGFNSQNCP